MGPIETQLFDSKPTQLEKSNLRASRNSYKDREEPKLGESCPCKQKSEKYQLELVQRSSRT
jgi:hypothetical protein